MEYTVVDNGKWGSELHFKNGMVLQVDTEDLELIATRKWNIWIDHDRIRVFSRFPYQISLGKFLMGVGEGSNVTHTNGDYHDYRRSALKVIKFRDISVKPHASDPDAVIVSIGDTHIVCSKEDEDLVTSIRWTYGRIGYLQGAINGKTQYLHRLILARRLGCEIPKGMVTDHINRDRLDVRRKNLRAATPSINTSNADRDKHPAVDANIYKYGEYLRVGLNIDGKWKFFGYCNTLDEARQVRDRVLANSKMVKVGNARATRVSLGIS